MSGNNINKYQISIIINQAKIKHSLLFYFTFKNDKKISQFSPLTLFTVKYHKKSFSDIVQKHSDWYCLRKLSWQAIHVYVTKSLFVGVLLGTYPVMPFHIGRHLSGEGKKWILHLGFWNFQKKVFTIIFFIKYWSAWLHF